MFHGQIIVRRRIVKIALKVLKLKIMEVNLK